MGRTGEPLPVPIFVDNFIWQFSQANTFIWYIAMREGIEVEHKLTFFSLGEMEMEELFRTNW